LRVDYDVCGSIGGTNNLRHVDHTFYDAKSQVNRVARGTMARVDLAPWPVHSA
jgi:hypothetical protein